MKNGILKSFLCNFVFGIASMIPYALWLIIREAPAIPIIEWFILILLWVCWLFLFWFYNRCRYSDVKEEKVNYGKEAYFITLFLPLLLAWFLLWMFPLEFASVFAWAFSWL